jgi:hypothetical protein
VVQDRDGTQKYFTGSTSKKETLAIAQKLEADHRLVRVGYKPVPRLSEKPHDFKEKVPIT